MAKLPQPTYFSGLKPRALECVRFVPDRQALFSLGGRQAIQFLRVADACELFVQSPKLDHVQDEPLDLFAILLLGFAQGRPELREVVRQPLAGLLPPAGSLLRGQGQRPFVLPARGLGGGTCRGVSPACSEALGPGWIGGERVRAEAGHQRETVLELARSDHGESLIVVQRLVLALKECGQIWQDHRLGFTAQDVVYPVVARISALGGSHSKRVIAKAKLLSCFLFLSSAG